MYFKKKIWNEMITIIKYPFFIAKGNLKNSFCNFFFFIIPNTIIPTTLFISYKRFNNND